MAAVHARAGADVDDVIGGAYGLLVVLDHDDGVAEIAQVGQRAQQAVVVALVQADRGLVEDVHHAHQSGADLARQADALGLAAGQRLRAALEREVFQPDVVQKVQALRDLLDDRRRDFAAMAGQGELAEPRLRLRDGQAPDLGQRAPAHEDVARLLVQPRAPAGGADLLADVFRQFLAHRRRLRFAVAALHVGRDALERVAARDRVAALVDVLELDLALAAAVEDEIADLVRQRLERHLQIEARVARERLHHLEVVGVAPVPAAHRAPGDAQLRVRDDALGVEELARAQPVAGLAGADGVVERKQSRFHLGHRVAAFRAGELRREGEVGALRLVHPGQPGEAVGEIQRRLERLGQAQPLVGACAEAVHHDLDGVLAARVQLRGLVQLVDGAIDARADEALRAELAQQRLVLALAVVDHRRQQRELAALGQIEDLVRHLADGLRLQRGAVLGALWRAGARVQQAQIVVDLGDGAHG